MTLSTLAPATSEVQGTLFQPRIDLRKFPLGSTFLRIMGVDYVHLSMGDKGDLYLTHYGAPFYQHLQPENWYEQPWLNEKRQRLQGTGTVYRLPTKPVASHARPSIDLCIKWSRVGQDVPLDTMTLYSNINADFNSPFEEFALVEELRRGEYGPRHLRIRTQKPLGIYVPSERMQLWQTGRSRDKVLARVARRPGVEIDILRAYILIYGWIRGLDAVTAYAQHQPPLSATERESNLAAATRAVDQDLRTKGFMVIDHKPAHIITRPHNGSLRRRRDGKVAFAIVDYELLERTIDHENAVKRAARSDYLLRQRDRFEPQNNGEFPPHLHPARVLGVDYVYGRTESTGGALWVVGKDPELFAYFLPERWRMRQVVLSDTGLSYYVQTKDRIHLVWKISRVGDVPSRRERDTDELYARKCAYGYNSPFEKAALALEMARRGVPTSYPRAVYMTGPQTADESLADTRRFDACRDLRAPDGRPALPRDHDYITLFGYWRGCDDAEAVDDLHLRTPIDLAQATAKGIINPRRSEELYERHRQRLAAAGYVDLDLKPDHMLLSYIPGGAVKLDAEGHEELRHCNFELVMRLGA